jgi:hypothetical protein
MFTKAFTCAARLGPPARRIDVLIAPSIGFTSPVDALGKVISV